MAPPVNRKKAKRRQKQAARLVTEQQHNGNSSTELSEPPRHTSKDQSDIDDGDLYDHDDIEDEEGDDMTPITNGNESIQNAKSKKKKKKKSKARSDSNNLVHESPTSPSGSINRPQSAFAPTSKNDLVNKGSKERIWNTSTQEERENIKKFWLELGEDERRALVKVEKDAVLKKMKEQQKHSCSCTVCGRKRTAIEEELEVLYDAYYEELEQYANHNQGAFQNGSAIVPPPRLMHHNIHPLDHRHTHIHHHHHHHHPSHGRVHELPEDEDELEDDYDEEDDEEPYSDDELDDEDSHSDRADFFAFGNSLTVKDGILTVADDLLKNDGKHFIDMMEQLAERRMQREEDTQYSMTAAHQSLHAGHNHGPLDEEEYEDDEEEEGPYPSDEEEDYEDDDMDTMTEEQRMEEGRRMFQIFAARMFEQRVLTAYREKVAQQRQELLLQELLEEQTLNEQRTAKKAREAQKKKDKKKQQKQAREEEKARREAEKAAEEAAARALEEKKLEEQRRKKEELRKKKEAEKKAQEEERLRKEAEKQKRLQEERERQVEAERKHREQKERERKKREEAKKKEREEREAKERELREKKAKQERDRKVREEQAKRDSDSATKSEQAAKERPQPQFSSQPVVTGPKRTSQSGPGMITLPPGLQHPQSAPVANSPHFQVATPIVPKAPTPARPRQPSQQGSHASSPRSQAAGSTEPLTSISPQTVPLSQSSGTPTSSSGKLGPSQQPVLHHPQPSAPLSPLGGAGRSHPLGYPSMNGIPSHPPPGMTGVAPRPLGNENLPLYPPPSGPVGGQYRGFPGPNGVLLPPGIGTGRSMPGPGRGFPMEAGHNLPFSGQPAVPGVMSASQPVGRPQGHPRQASGSFERPPLEGQVMNAPMSRPTPIKRPSSPQKNDGKTNHSEVDDLSAQLGSSALLDDLDIPFTNSLSQSLPGPPVPSGFGLSRASFGASPLFPDPLSPPKQPSFSGSGSTWGAQGPFGVPFAPSWGTGTGGAWPNRAFGAGGNHRTHTSRPVAVRLLVIQAIKSLNSMSPSKTAPGFHEVNRLLQQVEQLKPPNEPSISLNEMLDICDTEGNPQNGGGSFIVKEDESQKRYVKFEPDSNSPLTSHRGGFVPGDIGSPVPGSSIPATFGGIGSAPGARQFSPPTSF